MRDDDRLQAGRRGRGDVDQRVVGATEDGEARLEPFGASSVGACSGPGGVDLPRCEPLPRSGIGFHEAYVAPNFADTERCSDQVGSLGGATERARPHRNTLRVGVDPGEHFRCPAGLLPAAIGELHVGNPLPAADRVPLALTVADHQEPDGIHRGGAYRHIGTMTCVAVMRLFAGAREAAGVARDSVDGRTLGDVLVAAREKYGADFGAILDTCRVWVNGDEAPLSTVLAASDEVAVLPPVSGGACP